MGLSVVSDPTRPGGGYAVLSSDTAALPDELAIEDRVRGQFLNPGKEWTRRPLLLRVTRLDPRSVLLGPDIVDAIGSDSLLYFYLPDGALLDGLRWPQTIKPSAPRGGNEVLPGPNDRPVRPQPPAPRPVSQPRPIPQPQLSAAPPRLPVAPLPPAGASAASAPATRATSWARLLLALAALAVAVGVYLYARDSRFEQTLVCSSDSPLHDVVFGGLIAPCHETQAPRDLELETYRNALSCAAAKTGCAAESCFGAYMSWFPNGAHRAEIEPLRDAAHRKCAGPTEDPERKTFAEFQACLSARPACDRRPCVETYRGKLTRDEFVRKLNGALDEAAVACDSEQYASFAACVAQAAACEAGDCLRRIGGGLETGPHAGDVRRLLEQKKADCAPEPKPEDAAKAFLYKYYQVHSEMGAGPSGPFEELYGASVTVKFIEGGSADRTGAEQAREKRKDLSGFARIRFAVLPPVSIACAPTRKCTVKAAVRSDYQKNGTSGERSFQYRVIFELENVLTAPRVVYEEVQRQ